MKQVGSLLEAAVVMRDSHAPQATDMLKGMGIAPDEFLRDLHHIMKAGGSLEHVAQAGMAIGYLYAMRQLDIEFGLREKA